MSRFWRLYSGSDGQSKIVEEKPDMRPFTDTEGAHGEGTPMLAAKGISFRIAPPGYVLAWHCAPRRQYSITLSGEVPSPLAPPPGCRFHTRCPRVMEVCKSVDPPMRDMGGGRAVACHLYET